MVFLLRYGDVGLALDKANSDRLRGKFHAHDPEMRRVPQMVLAPSIEIVRDGCSYHVVIISRPWHSWLPLCSIFLHSASVTVIQILVIFKLLPDSRQVYLVAEVLVFLFAVNGGIWG